MPNKGTLIPKGVILQAIADYMSSEGCSCCEDTTAHERQKRRMAQLLNVPPKIDKATGEEYYDFSPYRSGNA